MDSSSGGSDEAQIPPIRRNLRNVELLLADLHRHRVVDQPTQGYLRSEDEQLQLALRWLSCAIGQLDGLDHGPT